MSNFQVLVRPITIFPHNNAEFLEIAKIDDYLAIVRKGQFKTGDLVAYIPQGSVVPAPLIEEMGLTGRLGGREKNRVVAVRLRGVFSQGLCLAARPGWVVGQDVMAELGIEKYEPPLPTGFKGEVKNIGIENSINYDIEDIKRFPNVLEFGEEVVMTEKAHGTCTQYILFPNAEGELVFMATSKGNGKKGLAFPVCEANANNVYVRMAVAKDIEAKMRAFFGTVTEPVFVLGEIFGQGIQDLHYGLPPSFRVFDIARGFQGTQTFFNDDELNAACLHMGLPRVQVLYRGPFTEAALKEATDGKETFSGKSLHWREGTVVRPVIERTTLELGRVQLKSVSETYLLRKGGTEYN